MKSILTGKNVELNCRINGVYIETVLVSGGGDHPEMGFYQRSAALIQLTNGKLVVVEFEQIKVLD